MAFAAAGSVRASPTLDANTLNFKFTALFPSDPTNLFDFRVLDLGDSHQARSEQDFDSNIFNLAREDVTARLVVDKTDLRPEEVVDCRVQTLSTLFLVGVRERKDGQSDTVTQKFTREEMTGQCVHWFTREFVTLPIAMTEQEIQQAIADVKNNGEE